MGIRRSMTADIPLWLQNDLILASGSPRRTGLLQKAGIRHRVVPSEVDETLRSGESPEAYALRVARAKAEKVASVFPDKFILAADTVVDLEGKVLGKPEGREGVRESLRLLSGKSHRIVTAVVLLRKRPPFERSKTVKSIVAFKKLSEREIERYVQSGEGEDKAGGYAIQGQGRNLIDSFEGSYTNIVGLPMEAVLELLKEACSAFRLKG